MDSRKNSMLSGLSLASVVVALVLSLTISVPGRARSHTQKQPAASPTYEYEVASFKPIKPGTGDTSWAGIRFAPDGFTAHRESLKGLIQWAFAVQNYQVLGAPDWLDSEIYDIDAKMDGTTADELQKLSRDDRDLAIGRMLQALLADRIKLTIHHDAEELPVYLLVVAKNGPKLQQAKLDETYAKGFKDIDGAPSGAGMMQTTTSRTTATMKAQAMPMLALAQSLAANLHRPVLDKTGLAGKFDFTLRFAPENFQLQSGSGSPGPSETDVPFLLDAIQQQLGLKLETGKGPVEVIVIDHVERPLGN